MNRVRPIGYSGDVPLNRQDVVGHDGRLGDFPFAGALVLEDIAERRGRGVGGGVLGCGRGDDEDGGFE